MSSDERSGGRLTLTLTDPAFGQIDVPTYDEYGQPDDVDVDRYEIHAEAGVSYGIETINKGSIGTLYVSLLDAQGKTIIDSVPLGQALTFTATRSGSYYVQIAAKDQGTAVNPGAIGSYEFRLWGSRPDDHGLINRDPIQVDPNTGEIITPVVPANSAIRVNLGAAGDSDQVMFPATKKTSNFAAFYSPDISDLRLEIESATGSTLSTFRQSGELSWHTFTAPRSQEFQALVRSDSYRQTGDYDVFFGQRVNASATFTMGRPGGDTIQFADNKAREVWAWSGNNSITTGSGNDAVVGSADGNDVIRTGAGNDRLFGYLGHDILDGGDGIDLAFIPAMRDQVAVRFEPDGIRVTLAAAPIPTSVFLKNIEFVEFFDGTVSTADPAKFVEQNPEHIGDQTIFLFDPIFYVQNYSLDADEAQSAYASAHYAAVGADLGYEPNAWFSTDFYKAQYPDLVAAGLGNFELFQHFCMFGLYEGRAPNEDFADFDAQRYLRENRDVETYALTYREEFGTSYTNAAQAHFILYGSHEGRLAFDLVGNAVTMPEDIF